MTADRQAGVITMLIFGIEELPRPKGEGFLYYKLEPSGREFMVDYLNLYDITDDGLKALFTAGAQKAREALIESGRARDVFEKKYMTENMSDWAAAILKEVIENNW